MGGEGNHVMGKGALSRSLSLFLSLSPPLLSAKHLAAVAGVKECVRKREQEPEEKGGEMGSSRE
jgi:hypothetical protein